MNAGVAQPPLIVAPAAGTGMSSVAKPAPSIIDPNRSDGQRVIVILACITALVIMIGFLIFSEGGLLLDKTGLPIKDGANFIHVPRATSDILAIVGAITTFFGTILGLREGAAAGTALASDAHAKLAVANTEKANVEQKSAALSHEVKDLLNTTDMSSSATLPSTAERLARIRAFL